MEQSNSFEVQFEKHPIYKKYCCDVNGNVYSLKSGKIRSINLFENNFGYLQFHIYNNGKDKLYQVHRFIFECVNNLIIEKGFDIDHIDRNKKNNSISNLRIVSRTTNLLNRFSNEEIDEIPDDAIKIIKYNDHYFQNIYFSPSTNCLYRSSESYLFKILFKSYKFKGKDKIYYSEKTVINDINKKPVQIYLNKLKKDLGY